MKNLSSYALGLLALTFLLPAAQPLLGEEGQRHMKIVLAEGEDDEVMEPDIQDMYIGETREFTTGSGSVLAVTRTEEGHTITLDGEEISSPVHLKIHETEGDGEHRRIRKIIRIGDGEGDVEVQILGLGGDALMEIECDADEDCDTADLLKRIRVMDFDHEGGDEEHVVVIEKRIHRFGDEEGDDGTHVVIIKKKIRHSDEEED